MISLKSITNRFTKTTILLLIFILILSSTAYAVDHTYHYSTTGYPYPYGSGGKVWINYYYGQAGVYDYSYSILAATDMWKYCFQYSPFAFNRVYSQGNGNLLIWSANYGNTEWLGRTYHTWNPKQIQLNEYFHSSYGEYFGFQQIAAHEIGHALGLGHYNCSYEIMYPSFNWNDVYTGDIQGIKDIY